MCGCDCFKSSFIGEVFCMIIKKDGYRGFVRGWLLRMFFYVLVVVICWFIYEIVKLFFYDVNGVVV